MNTDIPHKRLKMIDQARADRLKIVIQEAADGSQRELARKAGLADPDITRLLKGDVGRRGRITKFNKIQEATGYSAAWLESGQAPMIVNRAHQVESVSDSDLFAQYMLNSPVGIRELAERMHRAPSTVSDYQRSGRLLNDDLKQEIADHLDVSVDEIFGRKPAVISINEPQPPHMSVTLLESDLFVALPFIPVKARAGFDYAQFWDTEERDTYRVLRSILENDYVENRAVVIEINGDSMGGQEGKLSSGDKVVGYEVVPTKWYTVRGVVGVLFEDQFVVKRVKKNDIDRENYLTLHSDNPSGGTFNVPRAKIRGIWRITERVGGRVE